ncbi:DUF6398 domain-containing protein [Aquibacillus halophilus]|uniref:DUF6398 domain-containing protein n=1 Tax=Aquibacillus halophilus TaxID=930132 RepID=UPI0014790515|nr:DUF6398 domain-containing protein [Aquibacillus halophilus]
MASTKEKVEEKKSQLLELTHAFSDEFLNEEYEEIIDKLILKMSRKREVPFLTGKIEIWAAAVIHALGTINFLFDKDNKPYVLSSQICDFFETKQSTTSQKSKVIRDMFKMGYFDSDFSVSTIQQNNPFNHLTTSNGFVVPTEMAAEQPLTEWELEIAKILGITDLEKNKFYDEEELIDCLEATPERLTIFYDYLQSKMEFPFSATLEQEVEPNKIVVYNVDCIRLDQVKQLDEYYGILVNVTQDGERIAIVPLAEISVEEEHNNAPLLALYHNWFWTY